MKTYIGYRLEEPASCEPGGTTTKKCIVNVFNGKHKRPLRPRNDIRNHSPDGFEWGYGGSGPAQLALALVADACGRKFAHPAIYQRVKSKIVAGLPHDGWTLTEAQIKTAVDEAVAERNLREKIADETREGDLP